MNGFHGNIALPLENELRMVLRTSEKYADMIETGGFVAVMSFLLVAKKGTSDEVTNFLKECALYNGMTATEIGFEKAAVLHKKFKEIYKV